MLAEEFYFILYRLCNMSVVTSADEDDVFVWPMGVTIAIVS